MTSTSTTLQKSDKTRSPRKFRTWPLQVPPATFGGLINYEYLITDPDLPLVVLNTLLMVFVPLIATLIFGHLAGGAV